MISEWNLQFFHPRMNFLNVLLNILLIKFSVKIISIKKRNRRRDYTARTKIPKLINLVFENFRSRYRRYTHEKKKKKFQISSISWQRTTEEEEKRRKRRGEGKEPWPRLARRGKSTRLTASVRQNFSPSPPPPPCCIPSREKKNRRLTGSSSPPLKTRKRNI